MGAAGLWLVLALPIGAGLGFTIWQSLGAWGALADHPGLAESLALSLAPGLGATLIAVLACGLILALEPPGLSTLRRWLAPLLALPHAALALGLAFLLAPSGPLTRALAPWADWQAPPGLALVGDGWGLTLTLGLVLKETPFLLFLAFATRSPEIARLGTVAATFGHGKALRFALIEWPQLYARLRLPILAVLAYGLTTVDMGAILGPGLPAPLSVEITRTATRADLSGAGLGAALALVQLALAGLALALWLGVEAGGRALSRRLIASGTRGRGLDRPLGLVALVLQTGLLVLPLAALALLALQSVTLRWPWGGLPLVSVAPWAGAGPEVLRLTLATLTLGLLSTLLALALALLALQARPTRAEALIWLPLILPQVAFLPGLSRGLIPLDLPPILATTLGHLVFVLPYLWLVLAGPWRAWNPRQGQVAATLGAGPWEILFRLRLPALAPSLAAALAVGLAVSVGQYLATLILSGGRIATLATEAVALATGPDRARAAALGLAQAALPLAGFALAALIGAKAFPSARQSPRRTP